MSEQQTPTTTRIGVLRRTTFEVHIGDTIHLLTLNEAGDLLEYLADAYRAIIDEYMPDSPCDAGYGICGGE